MSESTSTSSETTDKVASPQKSTPYLQGTYKGELSEDVPHGTGFYRYKDEASDMIITYSGSWVHGKREGTGTESSLSTHIPGTNYVGDWKNDQKHGVGKEITLVPTLLSEGYYGEWAYGKKQGLGVKRISFHGKIAGEYQNDELYNGCIVENEKVQSIIVNGKAVLDLFALLPGVTKKCMLFTGKKAIKNSERRYKEALERYQYE